MRLMLAVAALAGVSALCGCASSKKSEPKITWEEMNEASASHSQYFNPNEFAARGLRADACIAEAASLAQGSPDNGWAALKICAKNPDFKLIRELTKAPWPQLLSSRPDAPALLARLIANRGGSIKRDLGLLHEQRVPLFAFSAAMAQPETYQGQYVLIRAKVSDMRTGSGVTTVKLAELDLNSTSFEREDGPAYKTTSSYARNASGSSSGSGSASFNSSKFGSGSASGSYSRSGNYSSSGGGESRSVKTATTFDNVVEETGREALGRLPKPDPFLTPEKQWLVLAKFDGVRRSEDPQAKGATVGVLTVVSYFEPNTLVVY